MSKSPKPYLRHILDEIAFLRSKSTGVDQNQFLGDEVLKRAFVRSIEIIGEAVKNLPPELKGENPQVKWKAIAGTRDKLIHGYFGVDYEIIWDIVANELLDLEQAVSRILGEET